MSHEDGGRGQSDEATHRGMPRAAQEPGRGRRWSLETINTHLYVCRSIMYLTSRTTKEVVLFRSTSLGMIADTHARTKSQGQVTHKNICAGRRQERMF